MQRKASAMAAATASAVGVPGHGTQAPQPLPVPRPAEVNVDELLRQQQVLQQQPQELQAALLRLKGDARGSTDVAMASTPTAPTSAYRNAYRKRRWAQTRAKRLAAASRAPVDQQQSKPPCPASHGVLIRPTARWPLAAA